MTTEAGYVLRIGKRQQWERRLLGEFLRKEFPTTPYSTNVRLGALPPEYEARPLTAAQARLLNPKKRFADGLIYLPDKTILIEAKMKMHPGIISLLELYKKLFQETPDLRERWNLTIEMMLVYVVEDPPTTQQAREHGIRCIQHVPSWIKEWVQTLESRRRPAVVEAIQTAMAAPREGGG